MMLSIRGMHWNSISKCIYISGSEIDFVYQKHPVLPEQEANVAPFVVAGGH